MIPNELLSDPRTFGILNSSLDGLSTTREIAERCQELGVEAVGLSDHGTVAGHLDFARTTEKYGLKPLYAIEAYHGIKTTFEKGTERDQAHLLLGALTDEGLRNLWRLVDESSTYFRHVPRINWAMLEKYSEGLFATSACIQSLVCRELQEGKLDSLNRYLNIFKDNFYIELHTYPTEDQEALNKDLLQIAEERGIPTLASSDAHFSFPSQYEIHDAYVAAQLRENVYTDPQDRKMWHPKSLYIQSEDEIRKTLGYLGRQAWDINESFQNSIDLANRVNASLPKVKRHLPVFIPSHSPWLKNPPKDARILFIDLIEKGLKEKYGEDLPEEVTGRAIQELEVFLKAGLEHYFLQTWDMTCFVKEQGIKKGPARGSSAGSLLAYALGITDIDPLEYDLVFERFYNPGREKGFPDIDSDFPKKDREKVREYLEKRWGKERVKTIGNVIRMKPKSACDKTYMALGVEWKECDELKEIINQVPDIDIQSPDAIGWSKEADPEKVIYVMDHVASDIEAWVKSKPVPRQPILVRWLEVLEIVCSRVSHYGVHASGIVVSDVDLADELPCRWSVDRKVPVTIFPMTEVDKRQFVKQDILGLRNLDTLQEWENVSGREVEWLGLERQEHPEEMWEMLDQGLTLGIFQIGKGYSRQLCKRIKPRSIQELAVIVALNRPGPIRAGTPDHYIARREGTEEVSYDHSILEDVLDSTFGEFLYQEQVIQYFNKLGYSLGESDEVRKILGKKKPEQMTALLHGRGEWKGRGYLEVAPSVIGENAAKIIWNKLEGYAAYSFNASHAISYATLAFRTLYAKYTDPRAFTVALLKTDPEEASDYITEGRRMDIRVLPPDIDRSDVDVTIVDDDIIFGFANIKGIGKPSAKYIAKLRNTYSDVTTPEFLSDALEAEQKEWEKSAKTSRSPRQKLRKNLIPLLYDAGVWDKYEKRTITLTDRQKLEKELLLVVVSDNTKEIFDKNCDKLENCNDYSDLTNGAGKVRLPGVISGVSEKRTKRDGKKMGIVTVEYQGDEVEFVVFPQQWIGYKFLWQERTAGIFDLKKTDRGLNFEAGVKLS